MNLAVVPDHHVDYLLSRPAAAYGYLHGRLPQQGWLGRIFGGRLPADWPRARAREVLIDENSGTDGYSMHYLLNETLEPVDGATDLFQGWLTGHPRGTRRLGGLESYAFLHDAAQAKAFDDRLRTLDDATLEARWQSNVRRCNGDADPAELRGIRTQIRILADVYGEAARAGRSVLSAPRR